MFELQCLDLKPKFNLRCTGELSQPLADAAGKDISHWFDPKTQDIRRWVNSSTGLEEYFTPMGRFVHIPPSDPSDDFASDFDLPWWKVCVCAAPS